MPNYLGVVGEAIGRGPLSIDTNPRLIVDRIPRTRGPEEKMSLLMALERINCGMGSDAHRDALVRRRATRERFESSVVSKTFRIAGESGLAVGMGNPSGPFEVGMTLHRTIGVPYIPGSALRGLARAYAAYSAEPTEIFGSKERVGQVQFLDALPNADCRMKLSVLTPHFPDWYINGESPGEWMSPVPVSFLVIGAGSFTIDILGEKESCQLAARYLEAGLDELGIGSKTSSGYGWLLAEAQA